MAKDNRAKNWAEDKEFADEFAKSLLQELEILEGQREARENIWLESYSMWSADDGDPNTRRNYVGRANLKLPQLRKEVETMTRRLTKAMFPEDYLKADPDQNADYDLAVINTQAVRHYFDNVMNLQQKFPPWIKQGVILGTSPLRPYWKKDVNEVLYRKRYFEEDEFGLLNPKFKKVMEEVVLYDAPKVCVSDMFQTYIYPLTATDPSEIQRVYAHTKVTYEHLEQKFKAGTSIDPKFLYEEGKEQDLEFEKTQERLAALGESGFLFGKDKLKLYDLTEIWGRAEINGKIIPYVCEVVNKTHVIRLQQNPFWHQQPNFVWFRFILPPGPEFYGRGLPEASIPIQAMLDDTLNQTMDSTTLSLNAITIVNPAFAPNAESFEVEPNAIWWADPAGVKQFTFPELSDAGFKNVGALRSMISEMSDNQPQLPDPIAGKARSTGQAQLAINEWQTDLYSFVNQNIKDALEPLAYQVHSLLQQNVPDDQIIRIGGKYSGAWVNRVLTPSDLAGRYYFKWMGAISVENQAVKTQQMLQFLKIYPMLPPDAQIKIKWSNLLIKLLRDGFQIKDVQNIIETPELNSTISPTIENKILSEGGPVKVEESDDDELHIRVHSKGFNEAKDAYTRAMFKQHIVKHEEAKSQKIQKQQQMMAMMAQAQMMQQQEQISGQTKSRGRPPNNMMAQNPLGNQGQMSEATTEADMERGMNLGT